jgi:hypothetical protein
MTTVITSKRQIELENFRRIALDPIGMGGKAIVEDFTLVAAAKLDSSQNTLVFTLLESQNKESERKEKGLKLLALADIAYMYDLTIYIKKVNEATGEYSVIPLTYPEKTIFTGVKDGMKEVDAFQVLYGGSINFERGRTTLMKDVDLRQYLFAPDRQLSDDVYPNINNQAAVEISEKSILTGEDDIEFNIVLPKTTKVNRELLEGNIAADGSEKTGYANYVYIHLQGFRAAKCAKAFIPYREKNNKALGIAD